MLLGSGYCHIKQTAFLLHLTHTEHRTLTWEDTIFKPHHKNSRKLKSFSWVNSHKWNAVEIVFLFVGISKQRHLLKIVAKFYTIFQTLFTPTLNKLLKSRKKFFKVFLPWNSLNISRTIKVGWYSCNLYYLCSKFIGIFLVNIVYKALYKRYKALQFGLSTFIQTCIIEVGLLNNIPKAHLIVLGCCGNLTNSCFSNTSCGVVNNAFNSFLVIGVTNNTKIGYNIFYLLALIKAHTAKHTIRNIIVQKLFLKTSTLWIGAIQYCKITPRQSLATLQSPYLFTHHNSLFLIALQIAQLYLITLVILTIHILGNLSWVVANKTISCFHNALRRTIILFEFKHPSVIVNLLKVKDIIDVGSTKGIDTLCIVANSAHLLTFFG